MNLIIAIDKSNGREIIYKKYKSEKRAIKKFDEICDCRECGLGNLKEFDFELHDSYSEIINCTL